MRRAVNAAKRPAMGAALRPAADGSIVVVPLASFLDELYVGRVIG